MLSSIKPFCEKHSLTNFMLSHLEPCTACEARETETLVHTLQNRWDTHSWPGRCWHLNINLLELEHPDYPIDVKTLRANPLCEVSNTVIAATAFALPSIPGEDNLHASLHIWLLLNFVDSAEKMVLSLKFLLAVFFPCLSRFLAACSDLL